MQKEGFQAKAGDNQKVLQIYSQQDSDHMHLFRGRVDAANPRSTTQKERWTYWTALETAEFLGTSHLMSIPRDMLTGPALNKGHRAVSRIVSGVSRARSGSTCDSGGKTATLPCHLLLASIRSSTIQEPAVYTLPTATVYCYNTFAKQSCNDAHDNNYTYIVQVSLQNIFIVTPSCCLCM